jgi:5'-nucleotidase
MAKKVILVDMDDVSADFSTHIMKLYEQEFGSPVDIVVDGKITHPCMNPIYWDQMRKYIMSDGIFYDLPPVPDAIDCIKRLSESYEVFFCSHPTRRSERCGYDKYRWVHKYFGELSRRVIMTKDKTMVRGDILIDDKMAITGVVTPSWKHLLFDTPWNKHSDNPNRVTWDYDVIVSHL